MKNIPYGRQYIDEEDIKAVADVLKSDWITQGSKVAEFEEALAGYCGAKYAVAVSSGTAALHLACLAAGLQKGDEAITSPITFLATANSILYAGAKPVFADIDHETIDIDPEEVKKKITKRTKAVLPVHFAGLPCDMPALAKTARRNGLMVIEDGCHALGAEYQLKGGRTDGQKGEWIKVGSCRHSDMTAFSFHPVKHITTGEGGAVTTNSGKLYKKLKALRSHGTYKTPAMAGKKGPWYYEMRDLGFNYRITDFQCALGISQLRRVDDFIGKRREIARIYDNEFQGIDGVVIPSRGTGKKHVYHLYVLRIFFRKFDICRKDFFNALKRKGISCQLHYIPVYRQPYYSKRVTGRRAEFKNSDMYHERTVSIPMYPAMKDSDIRSVVTGIKDVLKAG